MAELKSNEFCVTIFISKEHVEKINLAVQYEDCYCPHFEEDMDVVPDYTGYFENGFSASIGMWNSEEGPWTDLTLFDANGKQVLNLEPEYIYFGAWQFLFQDRNYILNVVPEE